MTEWKLLAAMLYGPLKSRQCLCDYERNSKGVPIWVTPEGGGEIMRKLIRQCSRCAALSTYEAAAGVAA
jgi:hypothetical protein